MARKPRLCIDKRNRTQYAILGLIYRYLSGFGGGGTLVHLERVIPLIKLYIVNFSLFRILPVVGIHWIGFFLKTADVAECLNIKEAQMTLKLHSVLRSV